MGVWRQLRHQVQPPAGQARVASPAAFCWAPQDLWSGPGGALLPPVGQVSASRATGPARAPGEALRPRAPRAPPQPIHLGPHGGHFLRQACQGHLEPIQLLQEGSAKAAELLLQGTPTGARRLWAGERQSRGDSGHGGRLGQTSGQGPPAGPGCNNWSSVSRPQAPRFFTCPWLPGQGTMG